MSQLKTYKLITKTLEFGGMAPEKSAQAAQILVRHLRLK